MLYVLIITVLISTAVITENESNGKIFKGNQNLEKIDKNNNEEIPGSKQNLEDYKYIAYNNEKFYKNLKNDADQNDAEERSDYNLKFPNDENKYSYELYPKKDSHWDYKPASSQYHADKESYKGKGEFYENPAENLNKHYDAHLDDEEIENIMGMHDKSNTRQKQLNQRFAYEFDRNHQNGINIDQYGMDISNIKEEEDAEVQDSPNNNTSPNDTLTTVPDTISTNIIITDTELSSQKLILLGIALGILASIMLMILFCTIAKFYKRNRRYRPTKCSSENASKNLGSFTRCIKFWKNKNKDDSKDDSNKIINEECDSLNDQEKSATISKAKSRSYSFFQSRN